MNIKSYERMHKILRCYDMKIFDVTKILRISSSICELRETSFLIRHIQFSNWDQKGKYVFEYCFYSTSPLNYKPIAALNLNYNEIANRQDI